jgi:hypothetical protein
MSPGLVDYISRALVKPADQRSSLSDLMRHPWILGHARWVQVVGLTAAVVWLFLWGGGVRVGGLVWVGGWVGGWVWGG